MYLPQQTLFIKASNTCRNCPYSLHLQQQTLNRPVLTRTRTNNHIKPHGVTDVEKLADRQVELLLLKQMEVGPVYAGEICQVRDLIAVVSAMTYHVIHQCIEEPFHGRRALRLLFCLKI